MSSTISTHSVPTCFSEIESQNPRHMHICLHLTPFVTQLMDKVLLIFAEDGRIYMYPLLRQVREKGSALRPVESRQMLLHIYHE